MPQEFTNGRQPILDPQTGKPADPFAENFITDDDFQQIPEGLREKVRIRLATLSRDNERLGRHFEKTAGQPRSAEEPANGKPSKPAHDPNDVSTWDDAQIDEAINRFEQWEAAYAADPGNEKAKAIVTDLGLRKEINKARVEIGRRAGSKAADEKLAPLLARESGKQEAEAVFGQVFQYLSDNHGGGERVSRLMVEAKDEVDRRLAAIGKSRQSATPHEVGMAMMAAVESRAVQNRDGSGGPSYRGRPEIAGEGFGGRARAGAPDADAKVSALLKQGRASDANREVMSRFLSDPGYVPPAEFTPQVRNDF